MSPHKMAEELTQKRRSRIDTIFRKGNGNVAKGKGILHFTHGSHPSPNEPIFDIACAASNVYANKVPVIDTM